MTSKEKRFETLVGVIRDLEEVKKEKQRDPLAWEENVQAIQERINWLYCNMVPHIPVSHTAEIFRVSGHIVKE